MIVLPNEKLSGQSIGAKSNARPRSFRRGGDNAKFTANICSKQIKIFNQETDRNREVQTNQTAPLLPVQYFRTNSCIKLILFQWIPLNLELIFRVAIRRFQTNRQSSAFRHFAPRSTARRGFTLQKFRRAECGWTFPRRPNGRFFLSGRNGTGRKIARKRIQTRLLSPFSARLTKSGKLVKFEGDVLGSEGASGVVGQRKSVKSWEHGFERITRSWRADGKYSFITRRAQGTIVLNWHKRRLGRSIIGNSRKRKQRWFCRRPCGNWSLRFNHRFARRTAWWLNEKYVENQTEVTGLNLSRTEIGTPGQLQDANKTAPHSLGCRRRNALWQLKRWRKESNDAGNADKTENQPAPNGQRRTPRELLPFLICATRIHSDEVNFSDLSGCGQASFGLRRRAWEKRFSPTRFMGRAISITTRLPDATNWRQEELLYAWG